MMRQPLLLLSALLILSCENSNESMRSEVNNTSLLGLLDVSAPFEESETVSSRETIVEIDASSQPMKQQIIKTGRLRYEVQDLDKAFKQVQDAIKRAGGYIQNDVSGKDYNQLYHQLTIRIPADGFDQALVGISREVAFFDEKNISQQDVSEEFIDLNARLKAKRALEDRYLNLLSKAINVTEMLEIERELAKIREEVEAKEGRLNYLKDQVSLSTMYVHFYQVTTETAITQSYGTKMWNALKSGWNGISVFFIGLLHLWPFLILLTIGVFIIRRWMKKTK